MKAEPRRLGMLRGNAAWGLVAASVVLLAISQLGLAAAKVNSSLEAGGGKVTEVVQLHHGVGSSRSLLWAGVTAADQSPTLPTPVALEEKKLSTHLKKLDATLQEGADHEAKIELSEKKLKSFIESEVEGVSKEVQKMNIKDTDSISNVEPVPGAPGPPGYHGTNGHNGKVGLTGPTGSEGRAGPRGGAGKMGVPGEGGERGPIGHEGAGGFSGGGGPLGVSGYRGVEGFDGFTDSWIAGKYMCPAAATETMRLTDCSTKGCRLETKFEDEWGSVCSRNFQEITGEQVCHMLGFHRGGKVVPNRGGGSDKVWLYNVKCSGKEGDIGDCNHAAWGANDCKHGEDVGLCCWGKDTGEKGVRTGESFFPRCPSAESPESEADADADAEDAIDGDASEDDAEVKPPKPGKNQMRLTDCSRFACRLEVFHEEKWGTVCEKGFNDGAAEMVCTALGFRAGGVGKVGCALQTKYGMCEENKAGTGAIWLSHVNCFGFERDLDGCQHLPWGSAPCFHSEDMGVCCKGQRGDPPKYKANKSGRTAWRLGSAKGLQAPATGGPPLYTPWGEGKFNPLNGYHFSRGKGLAFDQGSAFDPYTWTIYMHVRFDHIDGWRKILSSRGWGYNGLYLNSYLRISPDASLECVEPIILKHWYRILLSRDKEGVVRLWLNGYLCAAGKPEESNHYQLNPHSVFLFHGDDQKKQANGDIKALKMYNRTLSEVEIREVAKCHENKRAKSCENTITFSTSAPRTSYSSVWGGDKAGQGYGRGRLNSKAAWCAANSKVGEWMQMDTGSLQSIVGITTQGRRDSSDWVTGFKVQVSIDGMAWTDAFCGRYFKANKNKNGKVKTMFPYPLYARHVRVLPWSWYGGLCMRAGVIICERPCIKGELSYSFRMDFLSSTYGPALDPSWGEGEFDSIRGPYVFEAQKGLLLNRIRCISGAAWTIIIHAQLDKTKGWRRILNSKGWGDTGLYVNNNYQMFPSATFVRCKEVILPNTYYQFGISRSGAGLIKLYLNGEVCAHGSPDISNKFALDAKEVEFFHDDGNENSGGKVKRIRLFNTALKDSEVALHCDCRLATKGNPCKNLIKYSAPNERTIYSSIWADDKPGKGHGRGRLSSRQAWSAKTDNVGQFMMMDTGEIQSIAGVVTQGCRAQSQWVTSFKVQVSEDGESWRMVHCGRLFAGNKDQSTKVKTHFDYPVRARYVKIEPQSWKSRISMRAGVLLCERPCLEGHLDFHFAMSFLSSSKGPPLEAAWGEGDFLTTEGPYRFGAGQGLVAEHIRCVKGSAYSIIIEVALDSVKGWRRLMSSYDWDDNGLYVNTQLQLFPKSAAVRCDEELETKKMYKIGMTRSGSGVVSLFLHGGKCAHGSPLFSDKFQLSSKWVSFFRDDGSENSAGTVKRIRMWDQALSEVEMATLCGCTLAKLGKRCSRNIMITPPDYKLAYSSVWNNDQLGKGHARGRLRSKQAWSALKDIVGQWMQFNTGEIQSIAGVVTQGRRSSEQRVTAFKVEISDDGDMWVEVECGRIFKGNADSNTKVKTRFKNPVKAQFVRILPQKWNGHMSMRASVLVCERPCLGGKLDYTFKQDMLISKTKGPSLEALWGEGWFDATRGYHFDKGEGLAVEHNRCLKGAAYTIYIKASIDVVSGWRRLVQSDGWGDAGFYVNTVFQTFPVASGIKCEEAIRPGVEYQYVITRSVGGDIKIFLNGWLCGKGKPPYAGKYALDSAGTWFFRDDGSENTGGFVQKIMMWNKELTEGQVREECACELPATGSACKFQVTINAPYMNHVYSSVFSSQMPGIGHGRGRLNSKQAWSAGARMGIGDSMTIDTGELQSIAGIVTQGRKDSNQWVTSYKVQVSVNGRDFKPVECGRTFDANDNRDSKKKVLFTVPVRAQYVRILPQTWSGWMSMRAAPLVCERPCIANELDYRFKGSFTSKTKGPGLEARWGEGQFDAVRGYHFGKGEGLALVQSRCLKTSEYTIYIKATLDSTTGYRRIMGSEGWVDHGFYVNKYFMSFPTSGGLKCTEKVRAGQEYQYVITRSKDGMVSIYLNGYPCATKKVPYDENYQLASEGIDFFKDDGTEESAGWVKRIHIWGKTLPQTKVMALCGCVLPNKGKPCDRQIVMTPFKNKIKYSSTHSSSYCSEGRLNSKDAWCANALTKTEWMQLDSGEIQSIAGVIIQGRRRHSQWVETLKVQVSDDSKEWLPVECGRQFDASTDQNTKNKILFEIPVKTRYVRILPQTWHRYPSMRAGLLLCERPCVQAVLEYNLAESLASTTRGPSLAAPRGDGYFDSAKGYHFAQGQGLDVDEWSCVNKTAYTIYMNVRLDQTSGYRRLINSEGWGDAGIYVNKKVMTFPVGGQLKCDQPIAAGKNYQFVFSRASDGNNKLYLNGYLCGEAKLPYKKGYSLAPHQLSFMQDDGKEDASGWLRKIKIFNKQLSDKEAAAECGCMLTTKGKKCESHVVISPPDKKYKYSSTYANDKQGYRHGRGRINSRQAWSARHNAAGEYLQIDTGSVQDIQGVETQGRFQVNQWVTSFHLEVSDDGGSWKQIECGRIYNANKDQSTREKIIFREPVKGRHIRFVVQTWYSHISMRAAVLVCEQKCKNGELNYDFDGTLSSSTFGPMLTYDTMGEFVSHTRTGAIMYKFAQNEGLTVDEGKCVTASEWTINIFAKIDETAGKRQIIGSSAWGNDGLYVDTILRMVPEGAGLSCNEEIWNGKWYYFGLTRTSEGKLSLYLNGYECASDSPKQRKGFILAEHDVTFFNNAKKQNTAGYLRDIRVLNKAASKEDMASNAGCSVAVASSKKCKGLILLNPDYSNHAYSSLYAGYKPGVVWSRGRLNSPYCWYPQSANVPSKDPPYEGGNWMQIDTGEIQAIAGVATQGRPGTSQWVTYLSVKVSEDGSTWKHVACGRLFKANTDYTTTVEIKFPDPVKGRYVRIQPQRWQSYPAIRAGVLVCEKKCKEGFLDYTMKQELTSSSDGPQLTVPWGTGTFYNGAHSGTELGNGATPSGWRYQIRAGQGLRLDESECITPAKWTLIIHAKLDIVNSLRQIMGSKSWGEDGLYAKDTYRFMPQETKLNCDEILRNNVYYQFGLSRGLDGTVAIYLNGYKCAEGKPDFKKKYLLDPSDIVFFYNKDNSKNTGASIREIRMWNKDLSESDMARENKCKLPDAASGTCKGLIITNPPYSKHRYSSTWSNYKPGTYWGQGRLNDQYAWLPSSSATGLEKGEWMQMDLGSLQNVAGLVTQGRNDAGWWTKSYSVKVSEDGDVWASVACGMVFEANTDYRSKVTNHFPAPVKARYLRIYPIYYHGHPAIRAGILVCERKCDGGYLNYQLEQELTSSTGGPMLHAPWSEGKFFAGAKTVSKGNGHTINSEKNDQRYQVVNGGGLQVDEGSCIKGDTYTVIIRGRLNEVSGWRQVLGSSSWDDDGLFVNENYRMQPSALKMKCLETILAKRWYDFGLTRDDKGKLSLYLNGYLCASATSKDRKGYVLDSHNVRFFRSGDSGKQPNGAIQRIRMWDKALGQADMAKASHCSLPEVGTECKGVISMNPSYKHHRYSSVWGNYAVGTTYAQGMLNSPRAWLASSSRTGFEKGEWMQIDLDKVQDVAGLVTQGRGDGGWWVKGYSVRVSDDGDSWKEVACGRIFDANTDMHTKVKNIFPDPVKARFVRIYPMVYHGHPSMRAGVLVCQKDCIKGHLDYEFKESLSSSSDGPMGHAPWGEGTFQTGKNQGWYKFSQGQGIQLDASSCIGASKWTILIHVKLDHVDTLRQMIGSKAWSADGLYTDKVLRWSPSTDALTCNSMLQTTKWYNIGLTRASDGNLSLYLNGYRCAQGISKNKDGYKLDVDQVNFMHGESAGTSPSGYLRRIRLWNTVKSSTDMADLSGCRLATEADSACKASIIYNAPYSAHRYSKTTYNDKIGYRYGRGRLDSPEAFRPPNSGLGYSSGNWLQLDSGSKQAISGVVIQGRRAGNQFLRSFLARVSNDGSKWMDVECGRAFPGSTNWNAKNSVYFSKPLLARYVRIYADTYNNWPSWRAGLLLCEKDCKGKHLDYQLLGDYGSATNGPMIKSAWGSGAYTTGTGFYFDNGEGLKLDEVSCINDKATYTILLYARLRYVTGSRQVIGSKSWGTDGGVAVAYGANYQLIPSTADVECPWKIYDDKYYHFGMTRDDKGTVSLYLNGFKCASGKPKNKNGYKIDPAELTFMHASSTTYSTASWIKRVRTWGKALSESDMAESSGCKLGEFHKKSCQSPGVYNVRYSGHRYSGRVHNEKVGYGHGRGRLDSPQAWSSNSYGKGYSGDSWMELDAGSVKGIAGVVSQGRAEIHEWVTRYKVKASADGKTWDEVDCGRTFAGNTNRQTQVSGRFTKPITARYIRIFVDGYHAYPSMRAGLLLCDSEYTQQKASSWSIRVYKANSYMWDQPDISTLNYLGEGSPKYIDFSNVDDIRKYVKGVPEMNFVAVVEGTLMIHNAGDYKICGQSSDGSTIKVDGKDLVDNQGKHAVVEKCKTTKLKIGAHKIKLDYFQSTGDIDVAASYAGPDTDDATILLPADDFTMTVFSSKDDIVKKPDVSSLTPVGERVSIPEINFHSLGDFKKYVPDVPAEYFAIDFYGNFEIDMAGKYYFCTISDDGSRLWIDDEATDTKALIDNGGNHGNRRYCAWKEMSHGKHTVHGDYFNGGGGMHLQVTYRGTDTDDKDVDMRSDGAKMPKREPQSKWEMRLFQSKENLKSFPNMGTLDFLGSHVVPAIDFNSMAALQRYYKDLKSPDNLGAQWFGQLTIRNAGNYLFCVESNEGAHLWVDGTLVVNDGGRHGNRQSCSWKYNMIPGKFPTKVDWYNGLGPWNIKVSYKGPDTGNEQVLLNSNSASGPPEPTPSQWQMRIFMANSKQTTMPDPATMQPVGDAVVPYIDFTSISQFREWVPSLPNTNVVATIDGNFEINEPGTYELCSESAYGSHLWIEGNMLLDNGGRHSRKEKCSSIVLKKGAVQLKADFFTSYTGYLKITYNGPDTDGRKRAIMSDKLEMQLYTDSSTLKSVPASLAGLQKIGKLTKIPAINFGSLNDFRAVVPGIPDREYSAIFTGKITIKNEGIYTFCSKSRDGSILTIAHSEVIDNGGIHGVTEKCGSKKMKKGEYDTKSEFFQSSSGGYMVVTYQGPDTWGISELLGSSEPAAFKRGDVSQWKMRLFSSPSDRGSLQHMPNFAWLDYLGEATVTAIDFKNVPDLRRYVPDVPNSNFAGAWFGKTVIIKPGDYTFCTSSDDGSFLWLDDVLVVSNGGTHGNEHKCGLVKDVKPGEHKVKVTFFNAGGGMRIKATYIGPDSRGNERLLGATVAWAPNRVAKSIWNVKVFAMRTAVKKLPNQDDDDLTLKGEGTYPYINLHSNSDLRKIVSETPSRRYMWVYTGGLVIFKAGKYTICDASDDGSKVWIEGNLEIDNDGLHSAKEVCTILTLKPKTYYVKVAGFSSDSDCVQELKYAGPDTANRKVFVNSIGKAIPPPPVPLPVPSPSEEDGGGGGKGEDGEGGGGGTLPSALGTAGKTGLNIKCAQYRDGHSTLSSSKAMALMASCMAQDCVQSLENGGGHGNCRYMDTLGFCYSSASAQTFCSANKDNKFCKDGAEGGQKEWVPRQKEPIFSAGKATDDSFSCQCMKNCGCTKDKCWCSDTDQKRTPETGEEFAQQTGRSILKGSKNGECSCSCGGKLS